MRLRRFLFVIAGLVALAVVAVLSLLKALEAGDVEWEESLED